MKFYRSEVQPSNRSHRETNRTGRLRAAVGAVSGLAILRGDRHFLCGLRSWHRGSVGQRLPSRATCHWRAVPVQRPTERSPAPSASTLLAEHGVRSTTSGAVSRPRRCVKTALGAIRLRTLTEMKQQGAHSGTGVANDRRARCVLVRVVGRGAPWARRRAGLHPAQWLEIGLH